MVFILGAHKSGTSLLRSLLDEHPNCTVIPFETHVMELCGYWVPNAIRYSQPGQFSNDQIKERLLEGLKRANANRNRFGDSVLNESISLGKVERYLASCEGTQAGFVAHYLEALSRAIAANDDKPSTVVEKSVEHIDMIASLHVLFPNARFVHISRNPYANMVSIRKFRLVSGVAYPRLDVLAKTLRSSLSVARQWSGHPQFLQVNYEDLVQDPKVRMQEVANFLGLTFHESMLTPSLQGKKWNGNSSRDRQFSGISSIDVKAWEKDIYWLEKLFVDHFLPSDILKTFSIPKLDSKKYVLRHYWLSFNYWKNFCIFLFLKIFKIR